MTVSPLPASRRTDSPAPVDGVGWPLQIIAWSLGMLACVIGMLNLVAEWEPGLATVQMLWLLLAPILVMLPSRRTTTKLEAVPRRNSLAGDWLLALLVSGISLAISAGIGSRIGDLPPAYHDEFSYLFQAQTLLAGRFSFPSLPVHPELFDQMHVLNEGRMASRYYPGTGLWLAPFVALGRPYWGPWLAGAVSTMLLFWTGRELGGRFVGLIAGLTMAVSPGVGLFGNTLLAHHPTLVGLGVFLMGITRWRRTRMGGDASLAGIGLSYAMLCRPMTAAGIGLPFGIDVVLWLLSGDRQVTPNSSDATVESVRPRPRRITTLFGLGLPLVCGWCVMLAYNKDVTGEWLTSPYSLYTKTYTPRHVYGFNNKVRGEQHLGPKVIDHYDRWADNLTPALAANNAATRWLGSWLWSVDIAVLLMTTVVMVFGTVRLDPRWRLVMAAIFALHLVHVPYWYVGIMGWHYVFESAPLWCLLLAEATRKLFTTWSHSRHGSLKMWWLGLIGLSVAGSCYGPLGCWESRLDHGINSLAHPRRQQRVVRAWIEVSVKERPALVLIDQRDTEQTHLDFVTNEPGLAADILWGRYREGRTDLEAVVRDFPERWVFVCRPERWEWRSLNRAPE